jgi:hypothetical protein
MIKIRLRTDMRKLTQNSPLGEVRFVSKNLKGLYYLSYSTRNIVKIQLSEGDMLTIEEKSEFTDILDEVFNILLSVENNNYKMNSDNYSQLFRHLHGLKGAMGMFEETESAVPTLHEAENLLKATEQNDYIFTEKDFEKLYNHINTVCSYVQLGSEQNEEEICTGGRKDKNCEDCLMGSPTPAADSAFSPPILVIADNEDCPIMDEIEQKGVPFDHIKKAALFKDLGNKLSQYKLVFICSMIHDLPIALPIGVINKLNHKCNVVVFGRSTDNKKHLDNYSHLSYNWLGADDPSFIYRVKDFLNAV